MIEAELPDGRVLEFPDGTDRMVIQQTVKRMLGVQPQPQPGFMGGVADMARAQGAQVPTDADVTAYQRGTLRGLRDPIDAGAQLVTRAGELLPGAAGRFMTGERENVEAINRAGEQQFREQTAGARGGGTGRLIGNVAATAPLATLAAPTVGGAALVGGAAGALQPVNEPGSAADFWLEKAKQTGTGAAVSAATAGVVKGGAKFFQGARDAVKNLVGSGVSPTPGQTLGGIAQTAEEKATSIPLVGDAIKRAQMRSVEQFNRAAINKALAPIGKQLDMKTPMGREAIDEAITKVSAAYDDLLPKMSLKVDPQFLDDVSNLRDLAQNLSDDAAKQFDKILRSEVLGRINPTTGLASGETLQRIKSVLGQKASSYMSSSTAAERELGSAYAELQNIVRQAITRSNPEHAASLAGNDAAYAMLLRVQKAAAAAGSKEGVFSPAAMRGAVKALDKSLNKRQFARGDALMQDFAEGAESVLGPRVPDSGTAGRAMLPLSIPAAAAYFDPLAAGAAGAAMLPYTPMGQRGFANLMVNRGPAAGDVSALLNLLAPYAGAGAAGAVRR
jgi:hypothetical protein